MELSVENFDRICRACLCESNNMKSLFTKLESNEQSLLDLFRLAANLSARMDDMLPKQVCSECELILLKSEEFRNRSLASDTLLKKLFESSTQNQYYVTLNTESSENDDKSHLFFDKLSNFELQEVEKTDSECSIFRTDTQKLVTSVLDSVKKEIDFENHHDFDNGFEDNELLETVSIEYKDESLPKPREKSINNKLKKQQWKKDKTPKNKDFSLSYEFSCQICNINFDDLTSWENHLKTHPALKNNRKSNAKEDLRLFKCSRCFRRCKTKKTLSKHMKLHEQTDNIKFSCDKCKREFKYKSFLESHVISVHMHKDFTCHLCAEKFENKVMLEAHIDSHKDKKKHVCNICSKAFIMLCTLKDHMRKHTGEKPFLCSTCGKGFSQKTNLAQHTRRHLGVKPFKCDNCPKR